MSRNFAHTNCKYCPGEVVLVEKPRALTSEEGGKYYTGMLAANAECPACLAQYLAWCSPPPGSGWETRNNERGFYDLSFRHSFNDEPSDRDLPRYKVERRLVRVGLFEGNGYENLGTLCPKCEKHVLTSPRGYGMPEGPDVCTECDVDPWLAEKQKEKARDETSAMTADSRAVWNATKVGDMIHSPAAVGTPDGMDWHVPPVAADTARAPWNEAELREHGFEPFNWEKGIVRDIRTGVFLDVLGALEPIDFKKVREDWNRKQEKKA